MKKLILIFVLCVCLSIGLNIKSSYSEPQSTSINAKQLSAFNNIIMSTKMGYKCEQVIYYELNGNHKNGTDFYSIECINDRSFLIGLNGKTNKVTMLDCEILKLSKKIECFKFLGFQRNRDYVK